MIDFKEVVAKHVQPKPTGDVNALEVRLEKITKELSNVLRCESEVLPRIRQEKAAIEHSLLLLRHNSPYSVIDLSFLKWRRKQREFHLQHPGGLFTWMFRYMRPVFGLFRVDNSGFVLRVSSWQGRIFVNEDSDPAIEVYFKDLITQLRADYDYSWKLKGAIPSQTRDKIAEARKIFGCNIYIIQELTDQPLVTKVDPLIIGIKNDIAYLIDVYDATPVEQYIASEFSHG